MPTTPPKFSVKKKGDAIIISVPMIKNTQWEQWFLTRSDGHHDSTHCDRVLERYHLNQAKERGAIIIDYGDIFDIMQGKHDRRSSKRDLRPEYLLTMQKHRKSYLDTVLQESSRFYQPYAKNFAMISPGNHETGVSMHADTNLTHRLVDNLNAKSGQCIVGGYDGFLKLSFETQTHLNGKPHTSKQGKTVYYHHGWGGSAPVTKGVIDFQRLSAEVQADIYLLGHKHTKNIGYIGNTRITSGGKKVTENRTFIRTPGYKNRGEWETEKGFQQQPLGAAWIRFFMSSRDVDKGRIRYECFHTAE